MSDSVDEQSDEDRRSIWDFYSKDGKNVKCVQCDKVLTTANRSTTGLKYHLKSAHKIDSSSNAKQQEMEKEPPTKKVNKVKKDPKQKKIETFHVSDCSLDVIISRMVSKDGFTFGKFCTSVDLRRLFLKSGYKLPNSPTTIKSIVMNYAEKIKAEIVQNLARLRDKQFRFSLVFDEWTSRKNRRYLNINVFCGTKTFYNLGLVPIVGSFTAEACVKAVDEHIKKFNLSLEHDIAAICTDGPSAMVKVGRLVSCFHQLCYAHGTQLAVIDVLYKNKKPQIESENDGPSVVPVDSEGAFDSSDEEEEDEDGEEVGLEVCATTQNEVELIPDYNEVIDKVRKIVRKFRKSPTKNEVLQKYVAEEDGKQMQLVLDCKTRWNSLVDMLTRFGQLKTSISKAQLDLNDFNNLSEAEWNTITQISSTLEPVKAAVEVLCRRDATLVTAETTFRFILEKLDAQHSNLATYVATALRGRISQRRKSNMTALLMYLENFEEYENDRLDRAKDGTFCLPKTSILKKDLKLLLKRIDRNIYDEDCTVNIDDCNTAEDDVAELAPPTSIKEELQRKLDSKYQPRAGTSRSTHAASQLDINLKNEMAAYETTGFRGRLLTLAYNCKKSVPPTSTESERAFSAAGNVLTNLSCSLKDASLSNICLLRSHFNKKINKNLI